MQRAPRRREERGRAWHRPRPVSLRLVLGVVLALLALPAAGAAIERGDVLAVSVVEEPALDGEVTVDLDGRIALPRIGSLEVAGLDTEEVRARIERALREKGLVRAPSVRVEVARYRPFYVGGDVATPGAYPFEAGLTVRHALLLAGGPARPRDAAGSTLAGLADLRGRLRARSHELYGVDVRIARLESEMAGRAQAEFPEPGPGTGAVPPVEADAIRALDEGLLDDRLSEWEGDRAHLRNVVALLDLEIGLLARRAENQEVEQAAQRAELEDARDLVERGMATLPRVKELERDVSRSARDLLENQAFAARARQAKATAEHDLATAEVSRRVEIREALQEARGERVRLEAEIETLSTSLLAAGLDLAEDPAAPPAPEVTIYRAEGGEEEVVPARMTSEIRPGDVVEVSLLDAAAG